MARKSTKKKSVPKLKLTVAKQSALLEQLADIAAEAQPSEQSLNRILEAIGSRLGVAVAALELYNEATQAMQFKGITGLELAETDSELQMPIDFALSGAVVRTRAPVVENNEERTGEFWMSRGMKSYFGFPLLCGGRCLGALSLAHSNKVEIDTAFQRCAGIVARWLAQFVEAQLFRQSGEPAAVILEKLKSEYEQDINRLNDSLLEQGNEQKSLVEKARSAATQLQKVKQFYNQARRELLRASAEREELHQLRKDFEQIDQELRKTQQLLRSQSMQDDVTGLPNEPLFRYLFAQALSRSRRQKEMLALMYIDLDHFNDFRQKAGEGVADTILRQIADRLRRNVRDGDTVARVGLDEFVWSISNLKDMEDLAIIAEKMLGICHRPVQIRGATHQLTASIGITVYPYDSAEPDMLMQQAVTALTRAKDLGRDTYQFYTEEVNSRLRERLALKRQLHEALSKHEFVLHYQPMSGLLHQRIEGVEALLRWKNPDGKLAYPDEFLKVSEDTGVITQLDEWVLRTSCRQMQKWCVIDGSGSLFLSVNISQKLFQQSDFVSRVGTILKETGFAPHLLEIEVQEKTLVADLEKSIRTVKTLRDLGVRVSIDDFGTGALSLNQLKLLPVNTIKIDPAFTHHLPDDPANASVVAGIISLAHTMGFRVIAESLEQDSELKYLRTLKCDLFQGHLFRPPVPLESITDQLQQQSDEVEVEIPLEFEQDLLAEDPLATVAMPAIYAPAVSGGVQGEPAMAPAAEAMLRRAISRHYTAGCVNCRQQFDAMEAPWCSCLITERSLLCPHCGNCFCKAALEFKLDFWTEAPQGMWDRRVEEGSRFAEVKPNPLVSLASRPLVLVLDDERPILSLAAHLIESLGYGVVTGINGEEGLFLARTYKPDVILSDALMPRMDGREMCRKIKSDPQLANTKVAIMTSLSTRPRDRSTAYKEFKMDEYLQKPLSFDELRKVLTKFLPA